jgi:tRNA (guanine-N(7)-)-methyltransferase subunit TRM82
VLVACEGVPALFILELTAQRSPQVLTLSGNALGVTFIRPGQSSCTAVVSVDTMHTPGSTTEIRKDEVSDLADAAVASSS